MEIYLIRHTAPAIQRGICYGQLEVELDENLFAAQVESIKSKIPKSFDAVFSSPLKRCLLLGEVLSENVIKDENLLELNFGAWENKKWSELAGEDLNSWMNDFVNVSVPGGESYFQLSERVASFLKDTLLKDYKTVVVITHAGCIRSFLAVLLGLPLENTFRIQLDYGAVIHTEFNSDPQLNKLFRIC